MLARVATFLPGFWTGKRTRLWQPACRRSASIADADPSPLGTVTEVTREPTPVTAPAGPRSDGPAPPMR